MKVKKTIVEKIMMTHRQPPTTTKRFGAGDIFGTKTEKQIETKIRTMEQKEKRNKNLKNARRVKKEL